MRTRFWLALASFVFAAASGFNVWADSLSADQRALLKLENDWVAAENRHDVATLRAILNDKFVCTFGGGKPLGKQAFITAVTEGKIDPTLHQEISDRSVTVVGDAAVVVETDTVRRIEGGRTSTAASRLTVTYIKRGGRWQAQSERVNR